MRLLVFAMAVNNLVAAPTPKAVSILSYKKEYFIHPQSVQEIRVNGPEKDQRLTLAVEAKGAPADAYLVLDEDAGAATAVILETALCPAIPCCGDDPLSTFHLQCSRTSPLLQRGLLGGVPKRSPGDDCPNVHSHLRPSWTWQPNASGGTVHTGSF